MVFAGRPDPSSYLDSFLEKIVILASKIPPSPGFIQHNPLYAQMYTAPDTPTRHYQFQPRKFFIVSRDGEGGTLHHDRGYAAGGSQ